MSDGIEPEIHSFHIVAFLDMLGQKQNLSRIDKIFQGEAQAEEIKRVAGEVYGPVLAFRNAIRDFLEDANKIAGEPPIDRPPEFLQLWEKSRPETIQVQHFSDGLLLHFPLMQVFDRSIPVTAHTMLAGCASTMLLCLANRVPIRGGIDMGPAILMDQKELYGPVVASAYELESNIAGYPRIVIGSRFIATMRGFIQAKSNDAKSTFDSEYASRCLQLVAQDVDGIWILDFLADQFSEGMESKMIGETISEAFSFVDGEYNKFKNCGDAKLATRYFLLKHYFLSRMKK